MGVKILAEIGVMVPIFFLILMGTINFVNEIYDHISTCGQGGFIYILII